MKSFLIKKPATGRTTCTLVHQYYDKQSRRTKTTYLGSINIAANPDELWKALHLNPGANLTDEQVLEVQAFLRRFGTWGVPAPIPVHVMEEARRLVAEEIEARRLREKKSDLEEAVAYVLAAAQSLTGTAIELRASGSKLSKGFLSYSGTDSSLCLTSLDRLKVDANQIRYAFKSFEGALGDAGLIKRFSKKSKGV